MGVFQDIFQAIWHQDFAMLANPRVIVFVYLVMFLTLFLENGLLPASFLPGDSLLLLAGALIARDIMALIPTFLILSCAAGLGCWLSYLQGRWLGRSRRVKAWLSHLPPRYNQRAQLLFHRHGLWALLIGRFLAFVRTIVPTLAGISELSNHRFQLFNWISAILWVGSILSLGYAISHIPFVKRHEDDVMTALMVLPVVLLVLGLLGSLILVWRKKRKSAH